MYSHSIDSHPHTFTYLSTKIHPDPPTYTQLHKNTHITSRQCTYLKLTNKYCNLSKMNMHSIPKRLLSFRLVPTTPRFLSSCCRSPWSRLDLCAPEMMTPHRGDPEELEAPLVHSVEGPTRDHLLQGQDEHGTRQPDREEKRREEERLRKRKKDKERRGKR